MTIDKNLYNIDDFILNKIKNIEKNGHKFFFILN